MRKSWGLACWAVLVAALAAFPVAASETLSTGDLVQNAPRIGLSIGKSVILKSQTDIARVSVAQPEIADFVLLSPRQVYITGRAPGLTNLTLWDKGDKIRNIYDLDVAPDVSRLKRMLHDVLPNEYGLEVMASQDSITLSGSVTSAESLKRAASLAEIYAPGKVVNLLQVGGVQQVMLEVRVAEMSNSLRKTLKMDFSGVGKGDFLVSTLGGLSTIYPELLTILPSGSAASTVASSIVDSQTTSTSTSSTINTGTPYAGDAVTLLNYTEPPAAIARFNTDFGKYGNVSWTGAIDVLKNNGLVKVLAEPTLVCLNGQTAKFLAGGEIPVPVPSGLGTVAIEWKQFGVLLQFVPTVLSEKRISLVVNPEVSELDYTNKITVAGYEIPAVTARRASTTVELDDGQSFAIAGMLKEESRDSVIKYPALGDIPVLGSLFKSSDFQKNETELVILVTAHFAKPADKDKIKLPTDNYRDPDDLEFYLGIKSGGSEGKPGGPNKATTGVPQMGAAVGRGALDGEFGQIVPSPAVSMEGGK